MTMPMFETMLAERIKVGVITRRPASFGMLIKHEFDDLIVEYDRKEAYHNLVDVMNYSEAPHSAEVPMPRFL